MKLMPHASLGLSQPRTILIVDADEQTRRSLAQLLRAKGYRTECVENGEGALHWLENGLSPALMILDLKLPGMSGLTLLREARRLHRSLPVIIVTAHRNTKTMVDTARLGAAEYVLKPYVQDLEGLVAIAIERNDLSQEIKRLRREIDRRAAQQIFLTSSPKMNQLKERAFQISRTDDTILLQGESGVGKEVFSRLIHQCSPRCSRPFLKINCAALPTELLESELFGYEKGTFTGAYRTKPGKFELAQGGTILLDEIGDMMPVLQAKLLQVLQDNSFVRLGGHKEIRADVRIIASTNKELRQAVRTGAFRADLYYRLNVIDIYLPPLRERRDEIPKFCAYFIDKYTRKYAGPVPPLSDKLLDLFMEYHWPGNIRELENTVRQYVILGEESLIRREIYKRMLQASQSLDPMTDLVGNGVSLKKVKKHASLSAEREIIFDTLQQTNWNQTRAAEILRISYKALLYKMRYCGIKSLRRA